MREGVSVGCALAFAVNRTLNTMAIRVNGEFIEDERFHRAFLEQSGGRTPEQVRQHAPSEFQSTLHQAEQNVLREVLLQQFAASEGITATLEEVDEERRDVWGSTANESCGIGVTQDMADRITLRKAEQFLTRHVQRPDRSEVDSTFRANPSAFALPERWLVSHIVKFVESSSEHDTALRRVPNIIFAAHVHNYQRIEREIVKGQLTPFLVAGNGGYYHLHGMNLSPADRATVPSSDESHGKHAAPVKDKTTGAHSSTAITPTIATAR